MFSHSCLHDDLNSFLLEVEYTSFTHARGVTSFAEGGGGGGGGEGLRRPSGHPNSFDFMHFSGKFGNVVSWRSPRELAPLPPGNPGSTAEHSTVSEL